MNIKKKIKAFSIIKARRKRSIRIRKKWPSNICNLSNLKLQGKNLKKTD
jgi:hypothetical protein